MTEDEKTCPRCAETIKRAAVVCRYCGHEFGETPSAAPPQPSTVLQAQPKPIGPPPTAANQNYVGRILGFGCLGLLGLAFIGSLIGGSSTRTSNESSFDQNLAQNVVADPKSRDDEVATSDWSVSTQRDEVRGRTIYYAEVTSTNEVNFDFPYAGGSRLAMTVRKHPKYGDDVLFQISDGQFVCGIYDCQGTINYGSGPETLTLATPEDHDSKTLFAKYGPAVIKKLKGSQRVIVELPFYQEGNRQFMFNTKGLVWPPKG